MASSDAEKTGDDISVNDLRPLTLIEVDEHHCQKDLARYRKAQPTTPLTTRLQEKAWNELTITPTD